MLLTSGVWVILDVGPILGKSKNLKHGVDVLAIEVSTLE